MCLPDCCLDVGFSRILQRLARQVAGDLPSQVAFIRGTFVYSIVVSWASSVHGSIFDLECCNAQVRRFRVAGRPPTFATTAAKSTLSEFESIFEQQHGRPPCDQLATALDFVRQVAQRQDHPRPGPQKGIVTGWSEFSSYKHKQNADLRRFRSAEEAADVQMFCRALKQRIGAEWRRMSWEEKTWWNEQVRLDCTMPRQEHDSRLATTSRLTFRDADSMQLQSAETAETHDASCKLRLRCDS